MRELVFVLGFLGLSSVCVASIVQSGQCDPNILLQNNFNIDQFLGTWYEHARDSNPAQGGNCGSMQFGREGTGLTYYNKALNNNFAEEVRGNFTYNGARLTLNINNPGGVTTNLDFWILAVDAQYSSYALAYRCVNINATQRQIFLWQLGRTTTSPTPAVDAAITTALNPLGLTASDLQRVDRSVIACYELPVIPLNEPVVIPGNCDTSIRGVTGFNPVAFSGLWHEISSYYSANALGSCPRAEYTLDGAVVRVRNTEVVNQALRTILGSAIVISDDGSGRLSVNLEVQPGVIVTQELFILATDYDNYAVSYTCVNQGTSRIVNSWILGKTRTLPATAQAAVDAVINQYVDLNNNYYQDAARTDADCFYYPEPQAGRVVTFRGSCDLNIPVVTSFNVSRYLGTWYDLESYPSAFQNGSCNTANYALRPNTNPAIVDVVNTMVIGNTLDIMNGDARLATTDGSGKLLVTFPIAGTDQRVEMTYWILATDYDNYAFVYTCTQISEDTRNVWAWKLSRNKQLTSTAVTNINSIMNSINVLDQRYFDAKDHSTDGCFYIPEPRGTPVVFPGQCNLNIPVVTNFNFNAFQGVWHEIEAYPKEFQPSSQCINHAWYLGTGDSFNLRSFSVVDQSLTVTTSTVSSTDNSARMTIRLNDQNIEIPFWIIATDYSEYALAYSCVNENAFTKTVYSWKLSRSRTLSTAANTTITNAMANIDVLDNQYFERIGQTNEDCFHTVEPVILPGLCPTNIEVVSQFNASAAAFAGRWFDIESYPDGDYSGQCVDGRFNLTDPNTFTVDFSQVHNENLINTVSSATIAADGSGRLIVTGPTGTFEFLILATDYFNYALLYSCTNVGPNQRQVRSWKMSKTRELSQPVRNVIATVIARIEDLDERNYLIRDHSSAACFYYPRPVRGQVVRFRGRCDPNVAVVQSFNVAAYLGTWYDIESYPNFFQDGTCATAQYSLSQTQAGVVDVYNTQVVSHLLDTINGTAVVSSQDGSAKLTVTFPIVGTDQFTSTPYWVLDTDYDNYALVYSCNEIDTEHYTIGSWKLSRRPFLNGNSQIAIHNKMNEVRELRQKYYQITGHTEDDCLHYPDFSGGSIILDGTCPLQGEIDIVTNFNTTAFAGTWYEVSRFPSNFRAVECSSSELTANGNNFNWVQRGVKDHELYNITNPAVGQAGRGNFTVQFGQGAGAVLQSFLILDTDYTNFALVYSCLNRPNNQKQIYSYKLSRTTFGLTPQGNNRINEVISSNRDLFLGYYVPTVRNTDACFYYPRFQATPDLITMPGPCPSVAAVPNFNATRYLGRWFEIARFPQPDQVGTCSRAEYSLGNGVVDVRNTDVVNQRLNEQLGNAVVQSTDGSGILLVTFNVTLPNGNFVTVVADYYILATDYDDFALVYNCRNATNRPGHVEVYSWKLSRSRELSNAANAAINSKIEEVRGLLQEYYVPTSQSDDSCAYIPDRVDNQAPLIRGTCRELNITQNRGVFNATAFMDWWHEIESYPIDGEPANCSSSRFQQTGTATRVVDTRVMGLESSIQTFDVTFTDDWRIIRRHANGSEFVQYVLATDYTSYALVYSCENANNAFNDPYRRVWSAKLSRTSELSTAARTAMDSIIAVNLELDPELYMPILQTEEACFHYPDPSLVTERVTLRGQCDPNPPVQANFELNSFTGTWYQIHRYPYPEVSSDSTCIGTRFTLVNETTRELSVLNWEVVNGNLSTIEGIAFQTANDSATFSVTLPSLVEGGPNATAQLHILGTDYTSYAVAMTCFNVNQFERVVVAFQLSRSRSIPANVTGAIDSLLSQRLELHQPFFLNVTHNDDCEEPSSGYLVRSSIVVLLICAIWQVLM